MATENREVMAYLPSKLEAKIVEYCTEKCRVGTAHEHPNFTHPNSYSLIFGLQFKCRTKAVEAI